METPEQEATLTGTDCPSQPAAAVEPASLRTLRAWMRDLLFALVVLFLIIAFLYQPVKVEGGSMEPGLEDQERIFINKLVYHFESIERGDIVVFHYPRDTRKSFIKRVIGLPGDRIRIDFGRVYLNGSLLPEPYVPADYQDARSYPEIVVPDGAYFV